MKRQAWVRKHPKPAEPKEPKYHVWNCPKITRDPNVTRRHQQGDYGLPPPIYPPPEPARPTHGLNDEGRSLHDDNGLRRAQTTHRPQRYEGIPNYSQRETERLIHDGRGLGHAQSTRSQNRSRPRFVEDDSEDESGGESVHQSRGARVSELEGLPTHGERHGGLRHHGSRGHSRGQHDGRGRSRAQSNAGHSGHSQQRYDLTSPADLMPAQYSIGRSQ